MSSGGARDRLKAARARVRDQNALRAAIKLERRANLLESGITGPTPFDFLSAYSIILDRFRSEPWAYSVTNPFDRKYGRNFPIYSSEPELSLLRAPSRILCQTNCYAQALVGGLSSYIIGDGYTYRAAARERKGMDSAAPQGIVEAVQECVDRFLRRNQWNCSDPWPSLDELPLRPIEGETFERSLRDGEGTLLHYADPDSGDTDVRFVEPEFITQPPGSSWQEYSFGWRVPLDDEQKKLAAWISFTGNPAEGEEFPVRDISCLARNSDRIAKRGVPDFCFDAYDALATAQRLRRALSIGGAQKASIVGVRQHKGQTQAQVQSFEQGLEDFQQVNLVTGQVQGTRLYDPGTWEDISENLEYTDGPSTGHEGALVEVLNACLRGAVVRWNGFEWLVSADASSNSYANALAAESPAVRRVTCEQSRYKAFFARSVAIAVRNACDAGRVRANGYTFSWSEVRKYVEVQIEAPSPEVRDKAGEAARDMELFQAGLKSPQTICQEQGLDYEREMENLKKHEEEHGEPGMSPGGAAPPGAAPAGPPDAGGGDLGGGNPLSPPPSPPSPLGESLLESALLEAGFTGTDSHGHKWVNGKQVKANPDEGSGRQAGNAAAPNAPQQTQQQSQALDKSVSDALKDVPPAAKKGIFSRVKDAVHRVAVRINFASLAPDILDTIEDTQKIWYRQAPPIPGVPLSSGQLVAVGSYVLAKAALFIKSKLKGKAQPATEAEEPAGDSALDAALAFFEQMEAAGLGKAPSREQLAKLLGERQAQAAVKEALRESWLQESGFTGTRDVMVRGKKQTWYYQNGKRVGNPSAKKPEPRKPAAAKPAPADRAKAAADKKAAAAKAKQDAAAAKAKAKQDEAQQTAQAKAQAVEIIKDAFAHPEKITQDFIDGAGQALLTFKVDELKELKKQLTATGKGTAKADLVAAIKGRAIDLAKQAMMKKAAAPKPVPVAPPAAAKPAAPAPKQPEQPAKPPAPAAASGHRERINKAFAARIDATPDLSPQQKSEYKADMAHVIGRLPEAALGRIAKSTKKISFYSDTRKLGEELGKQSSKIAEMVKRGSTINGAFDPRDGKLHLDGKTRQIGDVAEVGGQKSGIRGTYAHELGHAVDWDPDSRRWTYSDTKEWDNICKEEIGSSPKEARLSQYATTNRQESFAELYRLVHGSDVDKALIEKRFPKASAYLKRNGLW